jgi:MYXO-CTERM domain-containing protein
MIRRALTVLFGLVTMVLLGTTPAWAHGGPIAIDVRGDGGQGVTATVTYVRDGHYVTGQVDLSYTAVSAGGRTVGPFPLTASAEGQSFYVSRNPLPLGDWTVTVTATHPSAATKTVSVTSAELPPVATTRTAAPSGLSTTTLVAIPVAVAVVGLALALVLRRRRQARLT